MQVLLSIKPEYVRRIFSGEKRFEFRKCIFRDPTVNEIYIYATAPVKMIVGKFLISDVHSGNPHTLWLKTRCVAGIQEGAFFEYFKGKETAYAIEISDVVEFQNPINPRKVFDHFVPPQSFMYIDEYKMLGEIGSNQIPMHLSRRSSA